MKLWRLQQALKLMLGSVLRNEEGGKCGAQTVLVQPDAGGLEALHTDDASTRRAAVDGSEMDFIWFSPSHLQILPCLCKPNDSLQK